jgi:hypothetical protein
MNTVTRFEKRYRVFCCIVGDVLVDALFRLTLGLRQSQIAN